jgi:hypothetical protein
MHNALNIPIVSNGDSPRNSESNARKLFVKKILELVLLYLKKNHALPSENVLLIALQEIFANMHTAN